MIGILEWASLVAVHTRDSLDDPVGQPGTNKFTNLTKNLQDLGFSRMRPVIEVSQIELEPQKINFTVMTHLGDIQIKK
jgi:hypothetical protein